MTRVTGITSFLEANIQHLSQLPVLLFAYDLFSLLGINTWNDEFPGSNLGSAECAPFAGCKTSKINFKFYSI